MSEVLTISKPNAVKAYNSASPKGKKMLADLLGEQNLVQDITEIVTSYEAACEVCDILPLTLAHFNFLPEKDRVSDFASHQIDIICRALNGPDFDFNYSDDDQEKWYIWWKWGSLAAGGSGFSLSDVSYYYSFSIVGARHSFRLRDHAVYAANKFQSIFNQFLKP